MRFKFSVILLVALISGTIMAQGQLAPAREGDTSEWKDFSSAEGQFTVSVPGTPTADAATVARSLVHLRPNSLFLEQTSFNITFPTLTFRSLPKHPRKSK